VPHARQQRAARKISRYPRASGAEVLDLAKGQRAAADKQQAAADLQQDAANRQHINAHKLETVGEALKGDVAALKTKLENPATK
jgi:hypothetical protein